MDHTSALPGFTREAFSWRHQRHPVWWTGKGPGVVIVHEVPGVTPQVADFARRVAAEGFTVSLPSLFGTPGRALGARSMARAAAQVCVRREFKLLAAGRSSPIVDYLRALCRETHRRCGGPGVGAVGMCLTGNFALSLMVDESVMAPVLSQPSLPLPLTRGRRASLHIAAEDLDLAKRRATDDGVDVLALRFSHDRLCPKARFDTLRRTFGERAEIIEIDSGPDNPHGIPRSAHSVLTNDLVDVQGHPTRAALERVLSFLDERLR